MTVASGWPLPVVSNWTCVPPRETPDEPAEAGTPTDPLKFALLVATHVVAVGAAVSERLVTWTALVDELPVPPVVPEADWIVNASVDQAPSSGGALLRVSSTRALMVIAPGWISGPVGV